MVMYLQVCFIVIYLYVCLPLTCFQVFKETFAILKPHIAEDFTKRLLRHLDDASGDVVTIRKSHLNECLTVLAGDIMAREKSNYEK